MSAKLQKHQFQAKIEIMSLTVYGEIIGPKKIVSEKKPVDEV